MKRILSALALAGALSLAACANGPSQNAIVSDAQALLATAESNGSISASDGAIVSDIITGFEQISATSSSSIAAGDSTTLTAAKSLDTAIGQLAADDTNATVVSDAKQAEALLGDIVNSSTGTITQAQLETAVATFLIDYLAAHATASATPGAVSPTAALVDDARAHIAAIR